MDNRRGLGRRELIYLILGGVIIAILLFGYIDQQNKADDAGERTRECIETGVGCE